VSCYSVQLNVNLVSLEIDKFKCHYLYRPCARSQSPSKIALPVTVQFGTPAGRGELAKENECRGRAMCRGGIFILDFRTHSGSTVISLFPVNACKNFKQQILGEGDREYQYP